MRWKSDWECHSGLICVSYRKANGTKRAPIGVRWGNRLLSRDSYQQVLLQAAVVKKELFLLRLLPC